jgi:hypothetical protein
VPAGGNGRIEGGKEGVELEGSGGIGGSVWGVDGQRVEKVGEVRRQVCETALDRLGEGYRLS